MRKVRKVNKKIYPRALNFHPRKGMKKSANFREFVQNIREKSSAGSG
jgi:hypothetical protein